MNVTEARKLKEMSAFAACNMLMERTDDVGDILAHMEHSCDTGQSYVVMRRLNAYVELLRAEARLLYKMVTDRNREKVEKEKTT